MSRNIAEYLLQRARAARNCLEWHIRKHSCESVFFYTFHKCASTLFGSYVLKNIRGLRNVDHTRHIEEMHAGKAVFKENGYVYGPIRLSVLPGSPVHEHFVEPVSDERFIKDRIAVFLIRDPRDVLVSSYYSFGFAHTAAEGGPWCCVSGERSLPVEKTINDYVLEAAPAVRNGFEKIGELSSACRRSVVLRYEDIIFDWERFAGDLTRYLDIGRPVLAGIRRQSGVRKGERPFGSRCGSPGCFRDKLLKPTVDALNTTFGEALERHGYHR